MPSRFVALAATCTSGSCGAVPIPGCVHDLGMSGGADMTSSGGADLASSGGSDMTASDLASGLPGGPADAGAVGSHGNGCGCDLGGAPKDLGASTPLGAILFLGLLLRRGSTRKRARS